tara:strand:- start:179 stop:388 length:210 start_codon:yes stop_codon:yes gene_type:complete
MRINVNGKEKYLELTNECSKLSKILNALGYKNNTIVVELNSLIVSSDEWEFETVKDGDKLEIVSIVGGG